ncbi:MAG: phosphodiesterase YaeI [Calditrichia bacterium]
MAISSRKKFAISLIGAAAGSVVFSRLFETQWLEVNQEQISLGLEKPLRLLHLSDLHASELVPYDYLEEAIELGLGYHPDIICITGDFITNRIPAKKTYKRLLQKLSAAAPSYGSFGNHDGGSWIIRKGGYKTLDPVSDLLGESDIVPLRNESMYVTIKQQKLRLVGLGDLWAADLLPETDLFNTPEEATPTIVLSHNPDTKDHLKKYPWQLLLAGHTHGGQFRLPGIGAPIAPVRDMRYVEGLHEWDNRWLHVSRGIGNVYGFRINCRPQVSILDLV